jgi:O-antigen/teichoic acid export membrane protein
MKIIEVLMVISGFYLNSVLPKFTNYFEKKKKEKLQKLLIISFKILFSF